MTDDKKAEKKSNQSKWLYKVLHLSRGGAIKLTNKYKAQYEEIYINSLGVISLLC